jgi:hypothetical protein
LSLLNTTFTIITKYLVTIIMFWDWWNVMCDYVGRNLMICTPHWRTQEFCSGGFNKFSWGQRTARTGILGR